MSGIGSAFVGGVDTGENVLKRRLSEKLANMEQDYKNRALMEQARQANQANATALAKIASEEKQQGRHLDMAERLAIMQDATKKAEIDANSKAHAASNATQEKEVGLNAEKEKRAAAAQAKKDEEDRNLRLVAEAQRKAAEATRRQDEEKQRADAENKKVADAKAYAESPEGKAKTALAESDKKIAQDKATADAAAQKKKEYNDYDKHLQDIVDSDNQKAKDQAAAEAAAATAGNTPQSADNTPPAPQFDEQGYRIDNNSKPKDYNTSSGSAGAPNWTIPGTMPAGLNTGVTPETGPNAGETPETTNAIKPSTDASGSLTPGAQDILANLTSQPGAAGPSYPEGLGYERSVAYNSDPYQHLIPDTASLSDIFNYVGHDDNGIPHEHVDMAYADTPSSPSYKTSPDIDTNYSQGVTDSGNQGNNWSPGYGFDANDGSSASSDVG